jgi:hypothetical protein
VGVWRPRRGGSAGRGPGAAALRGQGRRRPVQCREAFVGVGPRGPQPAAAAAGCENTCCGPKRMQRAAGAGAPRCAAAWGRCLRGGAGRACNCNPTTREPNECFAIEAMWARGSKGNAAADGGKGARSRQVSGGNGVCDASGRAPHQPRAAPLQAAAGAMARQQRAEARSLSGRRRPRRREPAAAKGGALTGRHQCSRRRDETETPRDLGPLPPPMWGARPLLRSPRTGQGLGRAGGWLRAGAARRGGAAAGARARSGPPLMARAGGEGPPGLPQLQRSKVKRNAE